MPFEAAVWGIHRKLHGATEIVFMQEDWQFPVERAKEAARFWFPELLKGYLTVVDEHAQKLVQFLHEETGKDAQRFKNAQKYGDCLCVKIPISLCVLDIVHENIMISRITKLCRRNSRYWEDPCSWRHIRWVDKGKKAKIIEYSEIFQRKVKTI
ncbi:hypothetical protein CEXT_135631 [Caerostris extrusa]|uniref:Uncharacterized protein n=1 Tax=Caerostris extrusa TaxID=172846 RepID=A0AAV4QG63_CAEEX|nr:hypothetical protein CEXT_135631 [Caerostris extrusa]